MKKFCLALTIALILSISNFAAAATMFTAEQFDKIVALTIKNPAVTSNATLNLDAATFKQNYDNFITNFIKETSAVGEDAEMMRQVFLLNDVKTDEYGSNQIFAKNFLNRVVIVGLSEMNGNFKVLNFFAPIVEERDDALFNVLVLNAFICGINPDLDATALLDEASKNPSVPVICNGVKFSVATIENINIVTAVAQ
ncbi:MAG: hypothetical protein J5497_08690 [Selenomonadaceae bacterium]|nr:hypothetical protein [Selenomonadaceae bacterium]